MYLTPRAQEIALGFLTRDFSLKSIGMTKQHALEEIARIMQCEELDDYYRISRAGSTLQLSRKGRLAIYLLVKNARNHARFEEELEADLL